MEIYAQNTMFTTVGVFDVFDSLVWTDRDTAYGDFELHLAITDTHRKLLGLASYLRIGTSKSTMVVETIEENEDFKVTGRSLESILERRIVEGLGPNNPTMLTTCITQMVLYNIGALAVIPERRVSGLLLNTAVPDGFTDLPTFDAYKYGDNLYTAVKNLCDQTGLGFKIQNGLGTNVMTFSFYFGKDRTVGQGSVLFAESLGNITEVSHLKSKVSLKNVIVVNLPPWDPNVPGVGELWRVNKTGPTPSDLDRREFWTDASELRRDDSFNADNKPSRAIQWGQKELVNHREVNSMDFKMGDKSKFKYDIDYFLGDTVPVLTNSGEILPHRVSEYIQSFGPDGISQYPTLTAV